MKIEELEPELRRRTNEIMCDLGALDRALDRASGGAIWDVVCDGLDARRTAILSRLKGLAETLLEAHDRRVTELLEANNALLERARMAEGHVHEARLEEARRARDLLAEALAEGPPPRPPADEDPGREMPWGW